MAKLHAQSPVFMRVLRDSSMDEDGPKTAKTKDLAWAEK